MSEFWIRKMRTYFRLLDVDKDGSVTQKDLEMMGERFCKSEDADAERSETIRKLFIALFRIFYTSAVDGVLKGDEVMTEAHFIESMKKICSSKDFEATMANLCMALFDLMDTDKDGQLQPEEHHRFFEQLGFDTSFTKTAFKNIDTNGDGVLSFAEFLKALLEYYISEDENSPYTLFFGDLV